METPWKLTNVCNKCLSSKINWWYHSPSFCRNCGHTGIQRVLMRYNISLFNVEKEYKQYLTDANPFEDFVEELSR